MNPVTTNTTKAGREKNRRVEFNLLDNPTQGVDAARVPANKDHKRVERLLTSLERVPMPLPRAHTP